MINPFEFRRLVIAPTLRLMSMYSLSAEALLLGTAMAESGLVHLTQMGGGPARGVYQMEIPTAADIARRYLVRKRDLARLLKTVVGYDARTLSDLAIEARLIVDLRFATVMARLKYAMDPEPLPPVGDLEGLAKVWKRVYNTPLGKGTAASFILKYRNTMQAENESF